MKTKALGKASRQTLVFQQTRIITILQARNLRKEKTLQGDNGVAHQELFQGCLPLNIERLNLVLQVELLECQKWLRDKG